VQRYGHAGLSARLVERDGELHGDERLQRDQHLFPAVSERGALLQPGLLLSAGVHRSGLLGYSDDHSGPHFVPDTNVLRSDPAISDWI